LERRKKLLLELYIGDTSEYSDEYANFTDSDFAELIKIRFTNLGGQSVVINPESVKIFALNKTINIHSCDWFGISKIPSPLNTGASCEIGITTDCFLELLNFQELDKFCNTDDSLKTVVPIYVSAKDHTGKLFFTNKFKYYYFVNSLERVT